MIRYEQGLFRNVDEAYVEQKAAEYVKNPSNRDTIFLQLLEALLKARSGAVARLGSGVADYSEADGNRISFTYDALRKALEEFDASRGGFCARYATMYKRLAGDYRDTYEKKLYLKKIRPRCDGVPMYAAPEAAAPVLRTLAKGRTYTCLAIREADDGDWYCIEAEVRQNGTRIEVRGYVPMAADVEYFYVSDFIDALDGPSDDDDEESPTITPTAPDLLMEEAMLLQEKLQYSMFAMLLAFIGQDRKSSGLSRRESFHLFFTEDTIRTLRDTQGLLSQPVFHERLIVKNMRHDWQDFLLTERNLRTFSDIAASDMKTEHEILQNGDHTPIEIAYATDKNSGGVDIKIRLPYLKTRFSNTEDSLRAKTSKHHVLFNQLWQENREKVVESRLSDLGAVYQAELEEA